MHKQHLSITDPVALTGGCGDCRFVSGALSRVDCSCHLKLNPCFIPCRYTPDICAVPNTNWTSHKNFIKLLQMCDAGIQKQVLHTTSVQFPLHDCQSVGIFIWEFTVLQKGKRSRDLIAGGHGNSHGKLHGPKMRNCPAMRSAPLPWSCKLLEALSHRNKSFIVHEVLYSGYSTHIQRHLTSAGLSMPRSQPWEGLVTRSLLAWEGRVWMAPSCSSPAAGSSSAALPGEYLLLPN